MGRAVSFTIFNNLTRKSRAYGTVFAQCTHRHTKNSRTEKGRNKFKYNKENKGDDAMP